MDSRRGPQPNRAAVIAGLLVAIGLVGLALSDLSQLFTLLAVLLATCAVAAELVAARYSTSLTVSAAFAADMLAVGFLGPAPAFVIPVLSYGGVWIVERYRWRALLINVAGSSTPAMLVAYGFAAIGPSSHSPEFVALLVVATAATMALNAAIVPPLMAILDGRSITESLRGLTGLLPAIAINCGFVAVIAGSYAKFGSAALAFVAINVIAFTYMLRLLVVARERTREYANLSWGVLSSLVRTLEERDSRAARHCAAVAAFSRDLAEQLGMSRREQELAHTAGLLHDIGKFALSDRVMERGGKLLDSDWRGIRRHPDIGARLLRDIGVYGPVADIVRAHHERVDGRGYPDGKVGEEIPLEARILAIVDSWVAITSDRPHRARVSPEEARRRMQSAAGTQLDQRLVEVFLRDVVTSEPVAKSA